MNPEHSHSQLLVGDINIDILDDGDINTDEYISVMGDRRICSEKIKEEMKTLGEEGWVLRATPSYRDEYNKTLPRARYEEDYVDIFKTYIARS